MRCIVASSKRVKYNKKMSSSTVTEKVSIWSPDQLTRGILIQIAYDLAKMKYGASNELRYLIFIVILWVLNEIVIEFVDMYVVNANENVNRIKTILKGYETTGSAPSSTPGISSFAKQPAMLEIAVSYGLLHDAASWNSILHVIVQIFGVIRIYTMSAIAYMITDTILSAVFAGMSDTLRSIFGCWMAFCTLAIINSIRDEVVSGVRTLATKRKKLL